jgi:hypothetical protein
MPGHRLPGHRGRLGPGCRRSIEFVGPGAPNKPPALVEPVQPGPMNAEEIGKQFGGQIAFSGGIDEQHLLTEGTPQQVKDQVHRLIDCLGKPYNNAYMVSPANSVTPEVPLENLQAMCQACHKL